MNDVVLVDTNVFTARLRERSELASRYSKHLLGRRLAVAPQTVAEARHRCRGIGHPLHQKLHNADLWVAATAVRWHIPLVAHDAVFHDCPDLDLRAELTDR